MDRKLLTVRKVSRHLETMVKSNKINQFKIIQKDPDLAKVLDKDIDL